MSKYLPSDSTGDDEESEQAEVVETDELQDFLDEMEVIEAAMESEPEAPPEAPVQYDPLVAAAQLSQKIHDTNDAIVKQDNVEAAMDKLAETLDPKISTKISDDDGPAEKQILIRSTQKDHERWKLAAERESKSLSGFVRDIVNSSVTEILDCSHPEDYRQRYPWKESCLKCGTTLWQKVETHLENRR